MGQRRAARTGHTAAGPQDGGTGDDGQFKLPRWRWINARLVGCLDGVPACMHAVD